MKKRLFFLCCVIIGVANPLFDIVMLPVLFLAIIVSRIISKKYSIGIGPLPMINNVYWKKALALKGYTVETYSQDVYYITNKFDFVCSAKQHLLCYLFPILLFIRCILRYECVYIYFNGGPLQRDRCLKGLEPYLLKLAKVKIVVMPYGSDCQIFERTPNKATVNYLCRDYPDFFRKYHGSIIAQVNRWSRNADIVVGTMDSVDYMFYWNRIIPCHFAIDTNAVKPLESKARKKKGDKIKILHAPNHMCIKGTQFLEDAIQRLKNENYPIEYVRIQARPNNEVIQAIQEADIVVDQLVMGWYAMFAMEAMACGKPCVCYIRDDLVDLFVKTGCLEKGEIPLLSASTDSIYDMLKSLLDKPEKLELIGQKSRQYVERRQSLDVIGEFFSNINKDIGILPTGV